MRNSWQKYFSLILAALLLALNVAVHFAHHHADLDAGNSYKHAETQDEQAAGGERHHLVCVACHFWVTPFAESAKVTQLKAQTKSKSFLNTDTPTLLNLNNVSYQLRAPPV